MNNDIKAFQELLEKVNKLNEEEINSLNQTFAEDFKKANAAKKTYDAKVDKIKKDKALTRYTYPFIIHMAGNNIETDHIFNDGKKYTEEEIRKAMLEHRYYEFSGKVAFEYLKDDNVLLPIFQQHKKG